jgi:hypothetical protein
MFIIVICCYLSLPKVRCKQMHCGWQWLFNAIHVHLRKPQKTKNAHSKREKGNMRKHFAWNPRLFLGTHDFLFGTYNFFLRTHDVLLGTHDFLSTIHDFLPTTHDFLPTTHDFLPTSQEFLLTTFYPRPTTVS